MKIAIASGKGGTGKTTLATSLVQTIAEHGEDVTLVDCDVEEPNDHIFLNPAILRTDPVMVTAPEVDQETCTLCGKCSEICRFNALACIHDRVLVFPELCHGCGGCFLVCPNASITEGERHVGVVEFGRANGVSIIQGKMNVGEAMPTPVVRAVKDRIPPDAFAVIDAPPGTSCPVVASLSGTDYVVLVTEPTPFGLNDLRLAVGVVRKLGIPLGVVINRAGIGDDRVARYCSDEGIDILAELPDSREVAEAYARGVIASRAVPSFARSVEGLVSTILSACPRA